VEGVFGVPFDRPIGHLRDYLRALRSLLDTGTAEVRGATLTADLSSGPPALLRGGVTPRVPLLVAAMGPQALRAAGGLADGTLPYLAGAPFPCLAHRPRHHRRSGGGGPTGPANRRRGAKPPGRRFPSAPHATPWLSCQIQA
jgi:alkanesulfonate monooxygenase SsuD/methylene tetrahydromethanopterin reductase-like flavin-dependent oxidoreductase (luciferase family)